MKAQLVPDPISEFIRELILLDYNSQNLPTICYLAKILVDVIIYSIV